MEPDQAMRPHGRSVVLSWGLPGAGPGPGTLADEAVGALLDWARRARMGGLLCAALAGGALELPQSAAARAHELHLAELRTTVRIEATAARVVEMLAARGVASRLLKGLPAAQLDYPDPAWRNSVDTDILIARDDLSVALDALAECGVIRSRPGLAQW